MSDLFMQRPSQVITNTIQYTEYNLYLHGEIGGADDFMEHFSVFKSAAEGDVIRLYITSEGGSLSTGIEYIRHMRECRAPIIGVLGVEVASMASAIALECDEIEVDEMTTMLIHSFSYGTIDSSPSIFTKASFNNKLNDRWIRKHYGQFLDEIQISDALRGVDILLDCDEIIERWERVKLIRETEGCGQPGCTECSPGEDEDLSEESFDLTAMIDEAVDAALKKRDTAIATAAKKAEKRASTKAAKLLEAE